MAGLAAELELGPLELAEGVVRVAEAEMLAALRLVTIERGIDPRGLVVLAFGGAGPLHAAALAEPARHLTATVPARIRCALGPSAWRPPRPRRDHRPARCS